MFVDSHCHINFPELAARMEDVRAEMAQAQVDRALVISTTLETFSEVHGLALAYDNFWCTAGVHPDTEGVAEPTVAGLLELAAKPKVVGRAALDLGFDISFSGILTFKNAQDLRDIVAWMPMDRLLIETDSPYLAPVPHRGKTNQPAWVAWVAQQIADIKGLSIEAVAQATSHNFERLFSKTLHHASL